MKATTQSIEGSHVAIISKAYEVAEFITLALVSWHAQVRRERIRRLSP